MTDFFRNVIRTTEKIPVKDLNIDETYQHDLNGFRVMKITRNFEPYLVQPIQVSLREDGTYWVMDGQHTRKALELKFGDNHKALCTVYEGLSRADEARFFLEWNTKGKAPTLNEKYKARFAANDPDIRAYVSCFWQTGVSFSWKQKAPEKVFCSHAYGFETFMVFGDEAFCRALAIMKATNNGGLYKGWILKSIAFLVFSYPEIRDGHLTETLQKTPLFDIERQATLYSGSLLSSSGHTNSYKHFSRAVLDFYNNKYSPKIVYEEVKKKKKGEA